jgi:hypothetical protein
MAQAWHGGLRASSAKQARDAGQGTNRLALRADPV